MNCLWFFIFISLLSYQCRGWEFGTLLRNGVLFIRNENDLLSNIYNNVPNINILFRKFPSELSEMKEKLKSIKSNQINIGVIDPSHWVFGDAERGPKIFPSKKNKNTIPNNIEVHSYSFVIVFNFSPLWNTAPTLSIKTMRIFTINPSWNFGKKTKKYYESSLKSMVKDSLIQKNVTFRFGGKRNTEGRKTKNHE